MFYPKCHNKWGPLILPLIMTSILVPFTELYLAPFLHCKYIFMECSSSSTHSKWCLNHIVLFGLISQSFNPLLDHPDGLWQIPDIKITNPSYIFKWLKFLRCPRNFVHIKYLIVFTLLKRTICSPYY